MNKTRWIVGITGGIAAYKTPELVRLMKKQGAEVRVVMSKGAHAFVTPMTLQAVSQHPVYTELLDTDFEAAMGHIELARWAEGIVIAPTTANRLAALAMGMADDLLTTLCLATRAPIYVAPAMNSKMWHHAATQQHIQTLQSRGVMVLGPDEGEQACGEVGFGRMMEPEDIVQRLFASEERILEGLSVVVTAGPTREALDPVRYLSNRSSGKMGFALAKMASQLGAKVTLISGPVNLTTPQNVTRINVESADEMAHAVFEHVANADIFISTAAVADFQAKAISPLKMKKENQKIGDFVPTMDILATVTDKYPKLYSVGFAAETHEGEKNAKHKLASKRLDLVALNDVSRKDIGFESEENALTVFSAHQTYFIEKQAKEHVALALLKIVREGYEAKNQS